MKATRGGPRTKTLQVGGLVAVTSALQFAAAAAVGLLLFGSAIVFCALVVGGYYFVWRSPDAADDYNERARPAKDLARLERGLGRAHRGGGLGGLEVLARFVLRQLVAAGDKLAAFRRSVLGFSFTLSLADSAPLEASAPPRRFEISVIPAAADAPTALLAPPSSSLPQHLKLQPTRSAKDLLVKKKAKKARRRNKPKDLVTIFTSNLARDTPVKTAQRVETPPVKPSISDLMALKPAPVAVAAVATPTPVVKHLEAPSAVAAIPLWPLPTSKSEPVAPHAEATSKPVVEAPRLLKGEVEQRAVPHVETIVEKANKRVEMLEVEPEPVEEPEWELPPVIPRKVTLYAKSPEAVEAASPPPRVAEEEQLVAESAGETEDGEEFLFAIALDDQPSDVQPAEWTRLKPATSMVNAELREMVEELDAMSQEADAALAACSVLLESLEA